MCACVYIYYIVSPLSILAMGLQGVFMSQLV